MRPFSLDLRERVAAAIEHRDGSFRQIARRFRVSLSFVTRLMQHRRQTGELAPKPHGGGRRPALDEAARQRVRDLLQQHPDLTLAELRQRLDLSCSLVAVWRTLRQLKITRKKKDLHHDDRDRPDIQEQRAAFAEDLAAIDPERLVFVDESGATTALTRAYGWAPAGERVSGSVPGSWASLTVVAGMRLSGVVAPLAFAGAMDTPAFETWVVEGLVPELEPGDVVVWDNLSPHRSAVAKQAVESAGATVLPLPPHSPDLSPIEELWSKAKGALRSLAERTKQRLVHAIGTALQKVTLSDIMGWFYDRGLCFNQT
jgi:transposase